MKYQNNTKGRKKRKSDFSVASHTRKSMKIFWTLQESKVICIFNNTSKTAIYYQKLLTAKYSTNLKQERKKEHKTC